MDESSHTSDDVTVTVVQAYNCCFDNMQYCIPENERFRARSNLYCYPNICSIIKDHLSASDYEQLRRGCMGSILVQGVNMKINFQLIHHMMLHEVNTKKLMEMWFKVNGFISRFSLLEFHVVTGLPCIKSHEGPPEDVSFTKFFGKPKCSYSELLELFKYEQKTSPKKLIMAKLLLVEQVLLFRRSRSVSAAYLSLACDPEKFEKYPWGRESYELLLRSLKRASIVDRSDDRAIYEIYGYPLAFQAWILEALPRVADKFECTFNYVEGDPFSLHWVCDVKITYDQASMILKGEMEPTFPKYGEFVRKPGMEYEKEVADDIVDYIGEPVFSQTQEDPIYDKRKLRIKVYNMRFGDNTAPIIPQIGDVKEKGKVLSVEVADSDDFESPKMSMKHKNGNLVMGSKKQKRKVTEPIVGREMRSNKKQTRKFIEAIIGRRGYSGGLKEATSGVGKDEKSAGNLGMKFKICKNARRNDAKRKNTGITIERVSGENVGNKPTPFLTEGCEDASDMDVAEILTLLPIEVSASIPAMTTNEDKDEVECEGRSNKEASPANRDKDEFDCEGGGVAGKEHPVPNEVHQAEFVDVADNGHPLSNEVHETEGGKERADKEAYPINEDGDEMESNDRDNDSQFVKVPVSQSLPEEMPEWAKDLSDKLDRLKEMPGWAMDLLNRLDRLEKIILANQDSIVTVADILETKIMLSELMGARGQSSCPIPADPVSGKVVNHTRVG